MHEMTPGKVAGMNAVADEGGAIRCAAMDQRGSLKKALSKGLGCEPGDITDQQMSEFKAAVVQVLSPYATGVLLDPEWGLEGAGRRAEGCGLLMAYEKSGYDNTEGGRIPILLPDWTVRQSIDEGADCIKLLIYYNPDAETWVNDVKHTVVERLGAECAHHDVPFFLEFVGYPLNEADGLEYARQKPDIVAGSMAEFSKDRYHVDVLKVEIPVDLKYTSGAESFQGGEAAYSLEEATELYHKAAASAKRPFIYLSAGVSDSQFRESLKLAVKSGVHFSGVLCGRATWQDGIPVYCDNGVNALVDWLGDRGVQNIQEMNQILEGAKSWREF